MKTLPLIFPSCAEIAYLLIAYREEVWVGGWVRVTGEWRDVGIFRLAPGCWKVTALYCSQLSNSSFYTFTLVTTQKSTYFLHDMGDKSTNQACADGSMPLTPAVRAYKRAEPLGEIYPT